jgi:hypothetical protein
MIPAAADKTHAHSGGGIIACRVGRICGGIGRVICPVRRSIRIWVRIC